MICSLLKRIHQCGSALSREENRLKLEQPERISDDLRELLRKYKDDILEAFEYEEEARKERWLVLPDGAGFEKHIAAFSYIYIFREDDDTFTVWRGTWVSSKKEPVSEKTIVSGVKFSTAFERANNYVKWFMKKR